MKKRNINVQVKAKGIVTIYAIDIRDKSRKKIRQQNLLLNDYLNTWFTSEIPLYHRTVSQINECLLGTSNTETAPEQLGIQGSELASSANVENLNVSVIEDHAVVNTGKWVFDAGVGTGEVGEIVLQHEYDGFNVARVIFDPKIDKSEYIKLEVIWEIRVDYGNSVWTGTIDNGQRDGSPVTWIATINHQQKKEIDYTHIGGPSSSLLHFWSGEENPRLIFGTSNASSDIENDEQFTVKGDVILDTISKDLSYSIDYVEDSLERDLGILIPTSLANEPIAEIVIGSERDSSHGQRGGIMRITFDPPLDKVDTHRLYITPTFKLTTGGA